MNSIPKFVASRTLTEAAWNATVVDDAAAHVPLLTREHDLLVMGSGQLIQALREHGLVDEYEVWVHPIVLGAGKLLFEDAAETETLSLIDTTTTGAGITVLKYEVAGAEPR